MIELRPQYPLAALLRAASLARSTFYYQQAALKVVDKYAAIKEQIKALYERHKGRYGYRRITAALRKQGIDVKYMNPKEGRLTWCCGLILTAEAKEIDKAYDLIDAMLSPEAGEWLINLGYGHSNHKAFERVSEEVLAERGLAKNAEEHLKNGLFSRDNTRLDALQQMFEAVKAGA